MTQFWPRLINRRYRLLVPQHVNPDQGFYDWEPERFLHMERTLSPGDILFEVGAEQGWMSCIYAGFVGGRNMVLVEPLGALWPNIFQTWAANGLVRAPRACYCGFFSDRVGLNVPPAIDHDPTVGDDGWPVCAHGPIHTGSSFRHLDEGGHQSQQTTVDQWVADTGIVPDALTIDVEGSEVAVLVGARSTLAEHDVKVWVSVHRDEMAARYSTCPADIDLFMSGLGYRSCWLAEDHEIHVYWSRP